MDSARLQYLFDQYDASQATTAEEKELLTWLSDYDNREEALVFLEATARNTPAETLDRTKWQSVIERILPSTARVKKMGGWKKWMVAAGVVVALGLGAYLVYSSEFRVSREQPVAVIKDVAPPDKNRAMITLADGRVIYLDSLDAGTISTQNGIAIIKNREGQLEYKNSKPETQDSKLFYNTLSNPRGSKVIDMTLSDGSHVWLNAGSSITYPVNFVGTERNVKMNGEAYFEIAHDTQRPFIVSKGEINVTVLGTHFNVNAYDDDEEIKVTLLEGSVKVTNPASSVTIKPGEQAVVTLSGVEGRNPDLNKVMAWKSGLFDFENDELPGIMRQLSRWYDIDVNYQDRVNGHYTGTVRRQANISEVLKMLETAGGVQFEVEGKRVTVKAK